MLQRDPQGPQAWRTRELDPRLIMSTLADCSHRSPVISRTLPTFNFALDSVRSLRMVHDRLLGPQERRSRQGAEAGRGEFGFGAVPATLADSSVLLEQLGNGIPEMRPISACRTALKNVGKCTLQRSLRKLRR
jgi:hypothetical protein